ncbi:MAG: Maf family protein [Clostridia bacterium]
MCELILASSSRRRCEILKKTGVPFQVVETDVDEGFQPDEHPEALVRRLGFMKADKAYRMFNGTRHVIGADTLVFCDGILSKPVDEEDAFRILRILSGREHTVMTGGVVMEKETGLLHWFCEKTAVVFEELSDREILSYIATGEPMDKAGAYGIQDGGGVFVRSIQGCYYNVMGFPLNRIYRILKAIGLTGA